MVSYIIYSFDIGAQARSSMVSLGFTMFYLNEAQVHLMLASMASLGLVSTLVVVEVKATTKTEYQSIHVA